MTAPSPGDLWRQANGDRQRYVQLLRIHGLLVDRAGPRCPVRVSTSARSVAQCQSEAGHTGCHFAAVAGFWSDDDDRILLGAAEETHHRAARQPTDQERAVLKNLRDRHAAQVAKAHGGQGVLPAIGES